MKPRGFSLIELIVVLTIIGLSVSFVIPTLSKFSKTMELKGAVKKVSAILRYGRSEAVHKGRAYQVLFNPESREIRARLVETDENKTSEKVYFLPRGIDLKEIDAGSPQNPSDLPAIEFYPNGGSSGGRVVLNSQGRKGYGIKVHFLTGMVMVEEI
jgi:general secretion pathway protein H